VCEHLCPTRVHVAVGVGVPERGLVRGAMRLASWFTVGFECAGVTGITVACQQQGRPWASDEPSAGDARLNVQEATLGHGEELAVVVAVAYDPSAAAGQYLQAAGVPVGILATVSPAAGPSDQVVSGPGHAVALAQAIRNEVRRLADAAHARRLHLSLACPAGLALLLGHRWNRVPTTSSTRTSASHRSTPRRSYSPWQRASGLR
jgi:CBASS immunity sensor of nucleotide second messenger signals